MSCFFFCVFLFLDTLHRLVYYTFMREVYYTTKSRIMKAMAGCIAGATMITAPSMNVQAMNAEVVKTSVSSATYLLEAAIQESLDKAEKEVKLKIVSEKLDYRMTMDSFYEQLNPYIDTDYLDLIAAYLIVKDSKEYSEDLYSVPFVSVSVEKKKTEEYVPQSIPVYRLVDEEKELYEKAGEELVSEPMNVPVYKKQDKNLYVKTDEMREINLDIQEVTYGEVTLTGMTYMDLLKHYDSDTEENINSYKTRKEKLSEVVNGKGLSESVFIQTARADLITEEIKAYLNELNNENLTEERKKLIAKAVTLVGRVPYEWGGKSKDGKYDTTWWTIDSSGKQKGLDCSGYVQWCFRENILFNLNKIGNLVSTSEILRTTTPITKDNLQPGDLGLLTSEKAGVINHVGIYLGNDYWIHCSSGRKTVVIEQTDMFKVFREMPVEDSGYEEQKEVNVATTVCQTTAINGQYTDEDIYLLAQLVYNEANTEGLNGWIAVAEVVKNRVNSSRFPNSIREVIYQKDPVQFSNSEMIEKREPTSEQIQVVRQVLNGEIGVLNDDNVLYFRNAHGSTSNWGGLPYYTTINNHQFYKTA